MDFNKKEPKIFVISGKANAGKDTTAELINNYVKIKGLKVINTQFSSYIKMYAKQISGWNGQENSKPRSLLQELGTDIIRKRIDNNFFINRIIGDIKVYSYYFDVITISDARLPEELEAIKSNFKNVFLVNVIRPNFENNLRASEKKHLTEVALDGYNKYDYVIENSGTFEDLNEKLQKMLDEVL